MHAFLADAFPDAASVCSFALLMVFCAVWIGSCVSATYDARGL